MNLTAIEESAPVNKPQTFPVLHVRELAKGLEFYQKIGFILETECDGQALLSLNKSKLQLRPCVLGMEATGEAYFSFDCAEVFLQELHALEIAVCEQNAGRPWRMREFSINDPDGNLLRFGEKYQHGVYS